MWRPIQDDLLHQAKRFLEHWHALVQGLEEIDLGRRILDRQQLDVGIRIEIHPNDAVAFGSRRVHVDLRVGLDIEDDRETVSRRDTGAARVAGDVELRRRDLHPRNCGAGLIAEFHQQIRYSVPLNVEVLKEALLHAALAVEDEGSWKRDPDHGRGGSHNGHVLLDCRLHFRVILRIWVLRPFGNGVEDAKPPDCDRADIREHGVGDGLLFCEAGQDLHRVIADRREPKPLLAKFLDV